VITVAVRWGVEGDHVTVYRWVQRFTPLFADAARPLRHATGDRWFVDETYVKASGRWRYLYRAVDQYGQVIDVLRSEQRGYRGRAAILHPGLVSRQRGLFAADAT
jgi:transposase-like protein